MARQFGVILIGGMACWSASFSVAAEPYVSANGHSFSGPSQRKPVRLMQTIEPIGEEEAISLGASRDAAFDNSSDRMSDDPYAFPQKRLLPQTPKPAIETAAVETEEAPGDGLKLFRVSFPTSLPPLLPSMMRSEKPIEPQPTPVPPPPSSDLPFVEPALSPPPSEPALLHPDEVFRVDSSGCDALPLSISPSPVLMQSSILGQDRLGSSAGTVKPAGHGVPSSAPDPVMLDTVRPRTSRTTAPKVRAPLLERFFR